MLRDCVVLRTGWGKFLGLTRENRTEYYSMRLFVYPYRFRSIQGARKAHDPKGTTRLIQASPLAQVSLKVTTPLAGTETVVVVPESPALVLANVFPVAVTQADAALGVKPEKDV